MFCYHNISSILLICTFYKLFKQNGGRSCDNQSAEGAYKSTSLPQTNGLFLVNAFLVLPSYTTCGFVGIYVRKMSKNWKTTGLVPRLKFPGVKC